MQPIKIGDDRLSIEDILDVARGYREVILGEHARRRVLLCRAVVDKLLEKKVKVYGLTTGFASMRDVAVDASDAAKLSANLIRSHSAGVGDALPEDVVRAAMLLRAQALSQGYSGVTPALLDVLVALLNSRVYPYVPEHGSVGCSGDLAPLSHLTLVVMGDPMGRVHRRIVDGERQDGLLDDTSFADHVSMRKSPASYVAVPRRTDFVPLGADGSEVRERLRSVVMEHLDATVWPHELQAKEGLASNNGAVFSTAVAALAVHDGERLLDSAELATALSFEALQSILDPLSMGVLRARPHPGHEVSANNIKRALADSQIVTSHAPCGLNMAKFNRTMMGLRSIAREASDPADAARIEALRESMAHRQETIWDAVDGHRSRVLDTQLDEQDLKTAYPKALELRACRRALGIERDSAGNPTEKGGLDDAWRELIGWGSGTRIEDFALREKLTRLYLDGLSGIVRDIDNPQVQDDYSFRGAATVLGACRETCAESRRVVEIEANSATDNPLILLDDVLAAATIDDRVADADVVSKLNAWLDEPCMKAGVFSSDGDGKLCNWALAADAVRSAANFHGEPVGIAADHLAVAIAEVGHLAERRCAGLADTHHSNGLPSYLVWKPGLNSGLMIAQYCAASIVSESKILASPASVDSIPTGESTEDHVSMSLLAARKVAKIVENSEYLVAIELLTAYQGVQFRKPARLGALTRKVEDLLHARLEGLLTETGELGAREWLVDLGLGVAACDAIRPCILDDVVLAPAMEAVAALVRRGEVSALMPAAS